MIKRILSMRLSWLCRRDWASGDRRLEVVYGFNARLGETPPAGYVIQTACSDLDAVVHASETAVSVANRPCRATCDAVGMALAAADQRAFPSTRTLVLRGSRVADAGSSACAGRRRGARSSGFQMAHGRGTCRRCRRTAQSGARSGSWRRRR